MDRQTVYYGQLARETDILLAQQNTMVSIAKLSAGVLGVTAIVNGFTCNPTTPSASLNVVVGSGEVYQVENLEQTIWSSVPADIADTIIKQGIVLTPTTFGITPPATVGFSQVFLIETQYQDVDTGSTVLPYYNAANPASPFSGPGNAGSSQNTIRRGLAALQVKAGTAAATGSQVAPTADAGWTGMFLVTVANGASTITSGNIVQILSAPFIPTTLPGVPPGVLNGTWVYALDTGTANTYLATVWQNPPPIMKAGMEVRVKILNANTGASTFNLNGLGTFPLVRMSGSVLLANDLTVGMVATFVFDGANWQIQNYNGAGSGTGVTNNTFTGLPFITDSGTVNHLIGVYSPVITGGQMVAGLIVELKSINTNTSTTVDFVVNANAAKAIIMPDGSLPSAGLIKVGSMLLLLYDGTSFQLLSWHDSVAPLKVLEVGIVSGQQSLTTPGVVTKITCGTNVIRNTLSTSTWDNTNFTVGVGEDGLWHVKVGWSMNNLFSCSLYVQAVRIRSGVTRAFIDEFMTYPGSNYTSSADCFATGTELIDLQVGDVINFYGSLWGPAGSYNIFGYGNFSPIGTLPPANFTFKRIEGLH